jgi:hypothetical protein
LVAAPARFASGQPLEATTHETGMPICAS